MTEKTYAYIKNNEVVNTAVFDNPSEELLSSFINHFNLDEIAIISDEDFLCNKVVIGGTYDGSKFWLPKPYPSWIKNEELNKWEAPISMPEDIAHKYVWNEDIISWTLALMPEKPFNSWIFNNELYVWEAPVSYPEVDLENILPYTWNEETTSWQLIL